MQIAIICLLSLAVYGRTVMYGLVSDDSNAYARGQQMIKDKVPLWKQLCSEAMCHNICNKKRCHVYNILVHTANCVLIYIVFGSSTTSFIASLLFLVNPSNNQGSTWLSGRGYAIVTFFALLIWLWKDILWLTPILYYAGLAWGFSIAFVPMIFVTTPQWYMVLMIPILVLIGYKSERGVKQRIIDKTKTSTPMMKSWNYKKIPLFFKTFWYYLFFCLVPIRCGMYHSYMYTWGISEEDNKFWLKIDWRFWLGILTFFLYMIILVYNWGNLIGFGMSWWLINMAMWCHYPYTIQQAFSSRYAYLPNVGLSIALAEGIRVLF